MGRFMDASMADGAYRPSNTGTDRVTRDRQDHDAAPPPYPAILHSCPLCDESLIRVRRRPLDRLISLFVPVERYRCLGFSCNWEGNLRIAGARDPGPTSAAPAPSAGQSEPTTRLHLPA